MSLKQGNTHKRMASSQCGSRLPFTALVLYLEPGTLADTKACGGLLRLVSGSSAALITGIQIL